MVSGNTESLTYAGNDGTCDHSWLTMLLGNAPQDGLDLEQEHFTKTELKLSKLPH